MSDGTIVEKAEKLFEQGAYEQSLETFCKAAFTEAAAEETYHNRIIDGLVALSQEIDDPKINRLINDLNGKACLDNLVYFGCKADHEGLDEADIREIAAMAVSIPTQAEEMLDAILNKEGVPKELAKEIRERELPFYKAVHYADYGQMDISYFYMEAAAAAGHEEAIKSLAEMPPPAKTMAPDYTM